MLDTYLQNLRNYRSNECINTVWKSPDLLGCLLYAFTEQGEVADCFVTIARPDDHRNNPNNKHTDFQKELQDLAMMVGSMILQLDPELEFFSTYNNEQYKDAYPEPDIKWFNAVVKEMATLTEQYRLYTLKDLRQQNEYEYYKWGILTTAVRIISLCGIHSDLLTEQANFFQRKTAKILGHNDFNIRDGYVAYIPQGKQTDYVKNDSNWAKPTNYCAKSCSCDNCTKDYKVTS